ncbi:MAG: uridine kinase [Angelakisella sp.]
MNDDIMIIGIAGGTGSGKTTVTRKLKEYFGDDISVLYHDNYYKRFDNLSDEERTQLNYDAPDAFDTDMMVDALIKLKHGEAIDCPVYDYAINNRTDRTIKVYPTKVVLVEGILIFENERLRNCMDIKIFVDTDADTRILRRIRRDVRDRGRTLDSVINQYLTTVKPMHEQYVQPSRKYADIVMLEGGHNLVALDMIIHRITQHIDTSSFAADSERMNSL